MTPKQMRKKEKIFKGISPLNHEGKIIFIFNFVSIKFNLN